MPIVNNEYVIPENSRKTIDALLAFVQSKPGIDHADYGYDYCGKAYYRRDRREATANLKKAKAGLKKAEYACYDAPDSVDQAKVWGNAFRVFHGRLSINDAYDIEYTAGQNYATEYRWAALEVIGRFNILMQDEITNAKGGK